MQNKNVWLDALKQWLPLGVAIIIFSGLVYVAVQQNYRMAANDPQIQIARDISTAISQGTPADGIVPASPTVSITASLSPFVTIYNATNTPIGSSVSLNGKLPTLPPGVFDKVKAKGESDFTWQPQPGVRIAAVVTRYSSGPDSGYILAGRSLKEVEIRENNLTKMTAVATALALLLSYLTAFCLGKMGTGAKQVEPVAVSEHAQEPKKA